MQTWKQLLALSLIFLGFGVGALVLVATSPDLDREGLLAGLWAGIGFTAVGIGCGALVPRVRGDQLIGSEPLVTTTPAVADQPAQGTRWPFEAIGAELARMMSGSPYVVESNAERIRVRADLADARFATFGGARRVRRVVATDIISKPGGVAITVDTVLGVTWTIGAGGAAMPRFTGKAQVFTGKGWSWKRAVEWGVGSDGRWGRQVEDTFSSSEIKKPVAEVLRRAGWRERWPTEARGAVVMVAIGASAIVIAPVALLLKAIFGW